MKDKLFKWLRDHIKPDAWVLGLSHGGIYYILISVSKVKGEGVPDLMLTMDITFLVIFLNCVFAHHFENKKNGVVLLIGGLFFFVWSVYKIAKYQYGLI